MTNLIQFKQSFFVKDLCHQLFNNYLTNSEAKLNYYYFLRDNLTVSLNMPSLQ
jgi:hypothetical protein